jgi:hypothetical protein
MILDDDDYLDNNTLFERIPEINKDEIVVWRMAWPTGRVIPENEYFAKLPFERKHIGMPCVLFHSDWIKKYQFDGNRAGDFRFFNSIQNDCSRVYFLNSIEVQIGNTGLNGKMEHSIQPGL